MTSYKGKKILGLINARGGSKGVPGKNKKLLLGKPLINYSIDAGLSASCLSNLIVSTDDEEIAQIAKSAGADVPFLRPEILATDTAKQIDAIIHAVQFMENCENIKYDYICLLQPTCPLRSAEDIKGSIDLIIKENCDSVITVTNVGGRHPRTLYTTDKDQKLTPFMENNLSGVQRQDFEDFFWRTGSVYVMARDVVIEHKSLYGETTCGYYVTEERCFNIDSPFDWDLCQAYLSYKYDLNTSE
ncbi:MAG: hypothetical protein CL565_02460 [Alphaproteobacteria bacterium]|nr:hypothetical protein [Alphaproteobacteria bacterium]|tara:strand:- start:102 stop:833 length:732 start_codon:yes stop_codon:yes gene_type:complete